MVEYFCLKHVTRLHVRSTVVHAPMSCAVCGESKWKDTKQFQSYSRRCLLKPPQLKNSEFTNLQKNPKYRNSQFHEMEVLN